MGLLKNILPFDQTLAWQWMQNSNHLDYIVKVCCCNMNVSVLCLQVSSDLNVCDINQSLFSLQTYVGPQQKQHLKYAIDRMW